MNLNDLKTFMNEILDNPEGITDINAVMDKSLAMYRDISEQFISASPSEREKLVEDLTEISQSFEARFDTLAQKMGMTKEELLASMQDPSNYTPEVLESVQNFQTAVDKEKKLILTKTNGNETVKPKKLKVKNTAPRAFA